MRINVFEEMRKGAAYDIRQEDYVEQVHSELNRCASLCQKINATDVNDKDSILKKEKERDALWRSMPETAEAVRQLSTEYLWEISKDRFLHTWSVRL